MILPQIVNIIVTIQTIIVLWASEYTLYRYSIPSLFTHTQHVFPIKIDLRGLCPVRMSNQFEKQ